MRKLSPAEIRFYRDVWNSRLPDYDRWLERFNFFELFPLDGGGYLATMTLLGTLDDLKIADAVLEGTPLRAWGTVGDLDYLAMAFWESAEYDNWLQRLYILAPLARAWRITGNTRYLTAFRTHFFDWHRKNQLPPDLPAYLRDQKANLFVQDRIKGRELFRTWFDFPPATRAFVICWSLYLAGEAMSDEDWSVCLTSLIDHAQILLANVDNWPDMPGNHQSWWSVGLFYLGCLFKEMPFSARALSTADSLLTQHLLVDMSDDGLSREGSPSYQLFALMHFREGWVTARRNGLKDPIPTEELEKMHVAVLKLTQPDGTVPAINDGYCGDARPTLELGASLLDRQDLMVFSSGKSEPPNFRSSLMHTSGLAVARTGWEKQDAYVVLDATRSLGIGKASHAHAGKLGIIYWAGGQQLVGDSGTCDYSDPQQLFGKWYRRTRAHSSLMIDGREDAEFLGDWEWDRLPKCLIHSLRQVDSFTCIDASSDGFMRLDDPVGFRRRLYLFTDGNLVVCDSLTCSGDHHYEFIFRTTGVSQRIGHTEATLVPLSDQNHALTIGLLQGPRQVEICTESAPFFQRTSAIETPSVIFSLRATGSFNVIFGLLCHQHQDDLAWERDKPSLLKRVCDDLAAQEYQL